MGTSRTGESNGEIRISCRRLLEEVDCLQQRALWIFEVKVGIDNRFRSKIKVVRSQISCWSFFDVGSLSFGELGLQLPGDRLSELAFKSEDVGKLPIVMFRSHLAAR